jgi:hypothetical protein
VEEGCYVRKDRVELAQCDNLAKYIEQSNDKLLPAVQQESMLKELAQTDLKREIEINIGQSHCMHAWTI